MAESPPSSGGTYTCPICLEILQDPVRITCPYKHVYCRSCVSPLQESNSPTCPECRCEFDPTHLERADDMARLMRSKRNACQWCGKQMSVCKLREHTSSCPKADCSVPHFKPIKETSQPIPSNVPNRSTFKCPYCDEENLESNTLIKHCNKVHKNCPQQVVCPICTSMPWGDQGHISANFLQHLNLRHKFEYDTYVDFQQDDDSMLQEALKASLANY